MKLYVLVECVYFCIQYLFFSFPVVISFIVFPPHKPFLWHLQLQKPFQSVWSRSHTSAHNSAVLLETFRPVWIFRAGHGDELLRYSSNTTLEGFQSRCLLYRGQMVYWAQGKLWMNPFCSFLHHLHTHHFKKITLLMASQNSRPLLAHVYTHTHSWCVFNIYWMFEIFEKPLNFYKYCFSLSSWIVEKPQVISVLSNYLSI